MATNIKQSNIRVECLFRSPTKELLVELFLYAILEGNAIHRNLFKAGLLKNLNLTLPEAMEAGKLSLGTITEWVEIIYIYTIN